MCYRVVSQGRENMNFNRNVMLDCKPATFSALGKCYNIMLLEY